MKTRPAHTHPKSRGGGERRTAAIQKEEFNVPLSHEHKELYRFQKHLKTRSKELGENPEVTIARVQKAGPWRLDFSLRTQYAYIHYLLQIWVFLNVFLRKEKTGFGKAMKKVRKTGFVWKRSGNTGSRPVPNAVYCFKSMFNKSTFYKSMFYKSSPCFTNPLHSTPVHTLHMPKSYPQ